MWVNLILPEEKENIRGTENKTAFLWLPSVFAFAIDLPMTLLFLPFSSILSCIVFSPSRREEISFARFSLLLHCALNIPLCFLRNFRSLAGSQAASNTFRGKGAGDRDREMEDCREGRLWNILERCRPCSLRGELLSRTVSDEKIRIINAERARKVQRCYIVSGVWKLLARLNKLG